MWKPSKMRAFFSGQPRFDDGCTFRRPVDALAGLGGDDRRRAFAGPDGPVQAIAAGQSAGGVDEDGFERVARHTRHADLGAALLEQAGDA